MSRPIIIATGTIDQSVQYQKPYMSGFNYVSYLASYCGTSVSYILVQPHLAATQHVPSELR